MRVTEKGQVTIPKSIRDKLGIVPGSEVEFVTRKDQVVVEKVERGENGADPVDLLLRHIERSKGRFVYEDMQADDIVALLRD